MTVYINIFGLILLLYLAFSRSFCLFDRSTPKLLLRHLFSLWYCTCPFIHLGYIEGHSSFWKQMSYWSWCFLLKSDLNIERIRIVRWLLKFDFFRINVNVFFLNSTKGFRKIQTKLVSPQLIYNWWESHYLSTWCIGQ